MWRNGRRAALRTLSPSGGGGSSPLIRIKDHKDTKDTKIRIKNLCVLCVFVVLCLCGFLSSHTHVFKAELAKPDRVIDISQVCYSRLCHQGLQLFQVQFSILVPLCQEDEQVSAASCLVGVCTELHIGEEATGLFYCYRVVGFHLYAPFQ